MNFFTFSIDKHKNLCYILIKGGVKMKEFKFSDCPVCKGELIHARLMCKDCKAEYVISEPFSLFEKLTPEQTAFLILFIKKEGKLNQTCEANGMSYLEAKSMLKGLSRFFEEKGDFKMEKNESKYSSIDYNKTQVSEFVKAKIREAGGEVVIPLLTGTPCIVKETADGESFTSDKLNSYSLKYGYDIFDIIVEELNKANGKVMIKGNSFDGRVGDPCCSRNTLVGFIAMEYLGKKTGESVEDPVFVLAAILDWAGVVKNCRGKVKLKEIKTDDLETKFYNELVSKVKEGKDKYKYNPIRFTQMLAECGGVETAKKLIKTQIKTGMLSEGVAQLLVLDRLDLTMEASVCKDEYKDLFTEEEIKFCKDLLKKLSKNNKN